MLGIIPSSVVCLHFACRFCCCSCPWPEQVAPRPCHTRSSIAACIPAWSVNTSNSLAKHLYRVGRCCLSLGPKAETYSQLAGLHFGASRGTTAWELRLPKQPRTALPAPAVVTVLSHLKPGVSSSVERLTNMAMEPNAGRERYFSPHSLLANRTAPPGVPATASIPK